MHTCTLVRYLCSYPQMAMMMENIIRVYGLLYGGLTGDTVEEEQEIIDMVERNFEDDLEGADQENISSPLAQAQEQVSYRASVRCANTNCIMLYMFGLYTCNVRTLTVLHL